MNKYQQKKNATFPANKKMLSAAVMLAVTGAYFLLQGCSGKADNPSYAASASLPRFNQASFSEYVADTRRWLEDNRVFISDNQAREIALNLPGEYQPEVPNGESVLLVHGLGDSPYSFVDIARHLAGKGYLVRTILLPGHGSKVGDLILPSQADWLGVVHHHSQLLKQVSEKVWLGGYSTGANLVTAEAIQDDDIQGLLLFSPAFKPESDIVSWAGAASLFVTWADQDPEDNYLRYNSLPMNGAAVYYQTSETVRNKLAGNSFQRPVFMMISEGDSVINTQYALQVFTEKMDHPDNVLVWQGETPLNDERAVRFSMKLPEQRISNGSHMGLLFSPDNPEYGISGRNRICDNGQEEGLQLLCAQGEEVWYSAWGYREPGKIHARLTYNPYFAQSMFLLDKVMTAPPAQGEFALKIN
ncbi:alpha/beta hydrolase [Psychromonas sp.]|uniref:alpha/beta hydrolase n=1 Tax=Psychromonas sp. TaxID=1884585 RepID=UPI0035651A98